MTLQSVSGDLTVGLRYGFEALGRRAFDERPDDFGARARRRAARERRPARRAHRRSRSRATSASTARDAVDRVKGGGHAHDLAEGRPLASFRLPEALVGGDDQPVRHRRSAGFALPFVAIVTLDVSAFEVALLGVVEFAPFMLISLPAGVWVDRLAAAADAHRGGSRARSSAARSIPLAYAFDVLTMGSCTSSASPSACSRCSSTSLTVVPPVARRSRDQLVDGNSKLEISRSGAQLAGPALAGVLVQALTAPSPSSSMPSASSRLALFVLRIRKQRGRAGAHA